MIAWEPTGPARTHAREGEQLARKGVFRERGPEKASDQSSPWVPIMWRRIVWEVGVKAIHMSHTIGAGETHAVYPACCNQVLNLARPSVPPHLRTGAGKERV